METICEVKKPLLNGRLFPLVVASLDKRHEQVEALVNPQAYPHMHRFLRMMTYLLDESASALYARGYNPHFDNAQ